MPQLSIAFRATTPQDDSLIADHFYQMWRDLEIPAAALRSDWQEICLHYLEQARQNLAYQAFVVEVDHQVVGSASGQIFAGLYPNIMMDEYRKQGYIWGVYVEPEYRGRGFAKQLTQLMVDYLKSIGCTRVVLNASPMGKPVYTSLGFSEGNLMYIDFTEN